jgi:cytidylate kinase
MRLVFLHGPPASGKLTIARELASRTGMAVFHNHLIVDAVAAVFPFGSDAFVRLREQFWLTVMKEATRARRSLIFTFAPEPTVTTGFVERLRAEVISEGGKVLFVALTVSADEQERRLVASDRSAFGKLQSIELLRNLRNELAAREADMPISALTIDTDRLTPSLAAEAIVQAISAWD